MQQVDDPPYLQVGTEVSAKYKGAFCEAKVSEVVRNIKVKVAYKQGLGSGLVSDEDIKASPGQLRVGAVVEVRHPDRKDYVEATVTKIQDCSQYTVVFDDGDITTLRRTALCIKSGRHFNESETLDQLPLTHPEHFGNPVVGGRRGRRRGQMNDDSSDEDDESDAKEVVNEKEEHIGKVVCVETESKKKDKEKWFPGLVVAPTAQATVRIRVKDEYLVRSFKDGRYYTVPKKEATEFTREAAAKQDGPAVQAALEYLDSDVLPPHWDRDALFGLSNSSSENEDEIDSDSSDDEPREEKDRFVAQLYKYMDDRGTPLNKVPSIQNKDVDLYRLFRAVQKRGGYNRVTSQNQWKSIAIRLGFTPVTVSITNLVKQAFKKFLQPYGEFHRKLGCSMLMSPRNSNRSKGRSLVRANSVASPKPQEVNKEATPISKLATTSTSSSGQNTSATPSTSAAAANTSVTEESENTSESSSQETIQKNKRKSSLGGASNASSSKVKNLVEKYEEKSSKDKDNDNDVPLSKIKAAAATKEREKEDAKEREREKEKEKEREREKEKEREKEREREKEKEKEKEREKEREKEKEREREKEEEKKKEQREKEREKEKEKEREREREREREKEKEKESGGSKESSGQVTRDSSPSGSNVSNKKDKTQRKQSSQSDDKRSKRRKDEIVVGKIDTGDFVVETGDKLKVYYHEKKVTYEAKVIEITLQRGTPMYLVHYTGWNNRYDEWVPRERIAENLTKGSKFKGSGRQSGANEKSKENPPKPPSAASLASTPAGSAANSASSSTSSTTQQPSSASKTPTAAGKRGRGRSDSMPPRSTTPSSVASNSSRTKSPATSSALKKRPQRQTPSSARRTSANVSDVSIATEEDSDTDSDEPVKRPIRNIKDSAKGGKSPVKSKTSISAPNSQSESDDQDDDDEDEDDMPSTSKSSAMVQRKGRDYDLNQIRSELKGFQSLKAAIENEDNIKDTKESKEITKIKAEKPDFDLKTSTSAASSLTLKEECKQEPKEEPQKRSSTELSSETDSFGDDESQSSDKTTQLENMRKKFQQIINAEKMRSIDKPQTSTKPSTSLANAREVEKIIKERETEKRQESMKAKPFIKQETKLSMGVVNIKQEQDVKTENTPSKDEEKKPLSSTTPESKTVILQPTKFPASATSSSSSLSMPSKYTSVIVEKPLTVAKKLENSFGKKLETPKKAALTDSSVSHTQLSKKFIEPNVHKEILKVEPPAACSPSSTSSTSSSTSSSSNTSSSSGSRFLPDMSKLDISGSSSSTSTSLSSPSTTSTSSTSYASACAKESKVSTSTLNKPNSPDVYEFKDNEPFEFEIRKSPMVQSNTSVITANLGASSLASTSLTQRQKMTGKAGNEHHSSLGPNPMSALVNRKKRGSPMKESVIEKPKLLKLEEKTTTPSPLVADAKLLHNPAGSSTAASSTHLKTLSMAQTKSATASTMHAPALPKSIPPSNTPASSASSLLAPVITPQKSANESSAFDSLRKSPSFNLNINALNEELAQTVQETTRALTDVLQSPQPPSVLPNPSEITPTKLIPEKNAPLPVTTTQTPHSTSVTPVSNNQSIVASPKLSTPPGTAATSTTKPQVGSPFIETRSVFGAGSSSRENKFELENAKVLLSATGGAFDFDPSKLETKPPKSSIADKVLKAISQKKEEEENKKQEVAAGGGQIKDKETTEVKEEKSLLNTNLGVSSLPPSLLTTTTALKTSLESLPQTNPFTASSTSNTSSLLSEPLKINTDLTSSSSSAATTGGLLSGPLSSFLGSKRTPLTSPEPKMGILESMGGTKNQLTETIQKLECAIQRRTPVISHPVTPTTPLSTTNPETFSDDSNDSTDSERRLVIEDVADDSGANTTTTPVEQKPSPVMLGPESCKPSATAVKLETTMGSAKISYATHHDIPAPIPIKAVTSTSSLARNPITTTFTTTTAASNLISITPANTSVVSKITPPSTTAPTVLYQTPTKPVIQANPQQTLAAALIPQSSTIQKSVLIMPTAGAQNNPQLPSEKKQELTGAHAQPTVSAANTNVTTPHKQAINTTRPSNPVVTASAGVPIVLPDIPASVVVASTAVPSVMAAAQAAAAALQTTKPTPQKQQQHQQQQPLQQQTQQIVVSQAAGPQTLSTTSTKSNIQTSTANLITNPSATSIITSTTVQVSNPTAFVSTAKTYDNTTNIRALTQTLKPITSSGLIQTPCKGGFQPLSAPPTNPTPAPTSTSGFYLDPRTELRPDDGLKPLSDIPTKPVNLQLTNTSSNSFANKDLTSAPPSNNNTLSSIPTTSTAAESPNVLPDAHNDSIIQLRCEETIPGSPASVIAGREDSQERTATSLMPDSSAPNADKDFSNLPSNKQLPSGSSAATAATNTTTAPTTASTTATTTTSSSPNDSGSQEDESSEDLKKSVDVENEISPRKRRRPRKQNDNSSMAEQQQQHHQQTQHHHQHSKRRRPLPCNKKNTAGSDSDDNSDNISQRSSHHSSRHQQHSLSQQTQQSGTSGSKTCPYNFLVQLDPSLTPDQCIAILLKQIQDLRKTYNIIKSDLASIDRRRKKLRRREREKKQQQLQNQQQMKVG